MKQNKGLSKKHTLKLKLMTFLKVSAAKTLFISMSLPGNCCDTPILDAVKIPMQHETCMVF